ncbi:MAG TPA: class I SAM-dependent methyltransferase [Ktedonobacteraceae bacterium]|nr:class I SAM-dependent methyltransferase [Ktedonobacteraceae bacterium]HEU5383497.1 class I SAM-dependent methyltransferase [Ktedonobacteraceae bacterium]
MEKLAIPSFKQQKQVNAYFQAESTFWKDVYSSSDVYAQIHQLRHVTALTWIDRLSLAPGSSVLEIGCGAGFMAIALAQKGLHVQAIDSTEAMIEQAQRNAQGSGGTESLSLGMGDVSALAFDDASFDLVVALGVIPWLETPELAIQEMARVIKPGGHLIFTADNRSRLNALLDPLLNPLLVPLKRHIKIAFARVGVRQLSSKDVGATPHSRRFIDQALMQAHLAKTQSKTLGFGPFTLFRQKLLPNGSGSKLHIRLQSFADRGVLGFRSTGAHYLVQARKPISPSVV